MSKRDRLRELIASREAWVAANCSGDEPCPEWKWGLANSEDADEFYELDEALEEEGS